MWRLGRIRSSPFWVPEKNLSTLHYYYIWQVSGGTPGLFKGDFTAR